MKDPAYVEKANAGPVGMLVVWPNGAGPTGKQLGLHFVYVLVISVCAAYLTGAVLPAGAEYLQVFRVAGTVAWLGYAGALVLNSIWYYVPWSVTWKNVFDGLVYALLTAGTFGGLWPDA